MVIFHVSSIFIVRYNEVEDMKRVMEEGSLIWGGAGSSWFLELNPSSMFFWVRVPTLSFPLWEDEVMEKIGKALGKFIGFTEVRNMVASSIKQ